MENYYGDTEFKIEPQKIVEFGEDVYSSRIYGQFNYEDNQNSGQDAHKRVSFIWRNGINGYGFAERILRFGLTFNNQDDQFVIKVYQNVYVSTQEESPYPDSIEVDPNFGVPVKVYIPTWDSYNHFRVSMLYIDENYRVFAQFLLLLSGVIIGIGTSLVSQVLIENLSRRK